MKLSELILILMLLSFFQLWRLFKPKTEDGIETAEDWFNFVDINSDGLITKYVPFQMLF